MNDFFLFLFFIDGILGLILFVKVWSMTSDVRNIRDRICRSQGTFKKRFTEYYLCGEYEEAYKFLNHYLACEIDRRLHNQSRTGNHYKEEFTEFCSKIIDRYSSYYEMIGKEVPENLKKVSFDSYNELV